MSHMRNEELTNNHIHRKMEEEQVQPPLELNHDKEAAIAAVKHDWKALDSISEVLRGDVDVVMAAVTQSGFALEFASKELKNDQEVVLAAVTQNGHAFKYAPEELQNNKEVALAAVTQDGWALQDASEELRNDFDVVFAAVTQDGRALQFASEELKNDVEMVQTAVIQNGWAFEYTSEALKDNAEVVQTAFIQLLIQKYNSKSHRDSAANIVIRKLIEELVSKQVLVPLNIIHTASACKLQWNHGMNKLIERDYSVLVSNDEATGLLPFMTFASNNHKSRNRADLNTLFEMLKKHPQSVRLYNTTNVQRDVMKKRDNEMTTDAYYYDTKLRKLNENY